MRIAYITAHSPWGKGETFILEEMLEIKRQGHDLIIIPRDPSGYIYHCGGKELQHLSVHLPVINFRIFVFFMHFLVLNRKKIVIKIILNIVKQSRNIRILLKNLLIIPKSIYISRIITENKVEHIHAHWGTTTATMAYVVHQLTGIPWSFTLHRWDIYENNMLREKVRSAQFVRCISLNGKAELLDIIKGGYKDKIYVVHMGVKVPDNIIITPSLNNDFIIATPANLIEVKGHKYLIESCKILLKRGIHNLQCVFFGEGPLKKELENLIRRDGLTKYIRMPGIIPHEKLLNMYKKRKIDVVVLPSINTIMGEHEGIPVALMEAMAFGIPVISTNTGGITELIGDESGIMVAEKDPVGLANAIETLLKNWQLRNMIGEKGRLKVKREFNILNNVKILTDLYKKGKMER